MNDLDDLICLIFIIFDIIFQLPDLFHISTRSKFADLNLESFLLVDLVHEFIIDIVGILTDV
mgnify:CR=1 FL=1